ncbi:MAG: tRNA epoxyqueuosine(34) reductase QueG [Deltaproteobacteria bacterium HGW-Deltaproteobacteria-15]|nr:MAG: tRNA epoxyqueuosine(34) reductase QueG [Deltaproteobacteria bacterium HGW-Deltaproteobacteria-15]
MNVSSLLRKRAEELGFAAVGFLEPQTPPHFDRFMEWLAADQYGQLTWFKRNTDVRRDPQKLLKGCRTIVSLALPYPSKQAKTADGFTIARYASSPIDYHLRLKSLCSDIADLIREWFPQSRSRIFVDSGPLLEKSLACGAGLGFIGKNNTLIIPEHGSYINLAEILTTAPFDFASPECVENRCGDCSRCIDACPTGALERPFHLNIPECLAYLTVEFRGDLKKGIGAKMGRCFAGCDRCQEVCPFNSPGEETIFSLPSTEEILNMDDRTFSEIFGRTALARPGLGRLKRNLQAIRAVKDSQVAQKCPDASRRSRYSRGRPKMGSHPARVGCPCPLTDKS